MSNNIIHKNLYAEIHITSEKRKFWKNIVSTSVTVKLENKFLKTDFEQTTDFRQQIILDIFQQSKNDGMSSAY